MRAGDPHPPKRRGNAELHEFVEVRRRAQLQHAAGQQNAPQQETGGDEQRGDHVVMLVGLFAHEAASAKVIGEGDQVGFDAGDLGPRGRGDGDGHG